MVQRSGGHLVLHVHFVYLELVVLFDDLVLQLAREVHGPFEHVGHGLQVLVQDNILADLGLQRVDDQFVRRLLLELKCEYLLENFPEILGYHLEYFLGVLDGQSLPQKVLELIVLVLELLVEVTPRKVVLIQEIDHNVKTTLYIISSGLVVATA